MENYQNNKDYLSNLFFIVFNGFGTSFSMVQAAIQGLEQCEIIKVKDLDSLRTYLMIAAGVIFGTIGILFPFYVISADRSLNSL